MSLDMPSPRIARITLLAVTLLAGAATPEPARADSVSQIATAVRISRATATAIDPQGRPGGTEEGTNTAVRPGDVLTFVAHFTPVPNGGVRGLGGYVTVYIPRNTEVVGVRIIDADGNTVAPRRGGFASDGLGPRGSIGSYGGLGLEQGSMSQLYADTGVFYSESPLTERLPDGSTAGEVFLALDNGIMMDPEPTAAGMLSKILNNGNDEPTYAHNVWDYIQALAFGVASGAINDKGQGNAPDGYGSAVAGPQTWYQLDAVLMDPNMPLVVANVEKSLNPGPWQRIATLGAEIGRRGNAPPMPDPGEATRVGVPATGSERGDVLDANAPLEAYDPNFPDAPHVRALRFAVGELLVGAEYLSEFSLRVLDTPLDPVAGADVVCAEVFGGDASAEDLDGGKDGKDNSWRYFVPAPACVSLDLLFDLDVDRLAALPGEMLTYDLVAKNLSVNPHRNVEIRHCYDGGSLSFESATDDGVDRAASGECAANYDREVFWTIPELSAGAQRDYQVVFSVDGGTDTIGRAVFTSDELPAPGFQTVAYTVIDEVSIVEIDMFATPSHLMTPGGQVTFTVTLDNDGTGTADLDFLDALLPTGFTYDAGSAMLDGVGIADPMQAMAGDPLTFTGLGGIPRQTTKVLTFTATVDGGVADGVHSSTIELWFHDPFKGEQVNNSRAGVGEVIIGAPRSAAPALDEPILEGANTVTGSHVGGVGVTVELLSGGVATGLTGTTDAGGNFSITVGTLYAGQRLSAIAQAPGELQSEPSAEVVVQGTVGGGGACSDGVDNDGDGRTDFPDDDGCSSAADPDEGANPACSDGIDNDDDGKTDFGEDEGCADLLDDDETGAAACGDGVDNDGDGKIDAAEDPGCTDADDVSEVDLPACADGVDNDGDGKMDFPDDAGCASALDDDETTATDGPGQPDTPDAGPPPMVGGPDAGTDGSGTRADAGVDPGGVDEPALDDGCGCSVPGGSRRGLPAWWPFAALLLLRRGRRRRR